MVFKLCGWIPFEPICRQSLYSLLFPPIQIVLPQPLRGPVLAQTLLSPSKGEFHFHSLMRTLCDTLSSCGSCLPFQLEIIPCACKARLQGNSAKVSKGKGLSCLAFKSSRVCPTPPPQASRLGTELILPPLLSPQPPSTFSARPCGVLPSV